MKRNALPSRSPENMTEYMARWKLAESTKKIEFLIMRLKEAIPLPTDASKATVGDTLASTAVNFDPINQDLVTLIHNHRMKQNQLLRTAVIPNSRLSLKIKETRQSLERELHRDSQLRKMNNDVSDLFEKEMNLINTAYALIAGDVVNNIQTHLSLDYYNWLSGERDVFDLVKSKKIIKPRLLEEYYDLFHTSIPIEKHILFRERYPTFEFDEGASSFHEKLREIERMTLALSSHSSISKTD